MSLDKIDVTTLDSMQDTRDFLDPETGEITTEYADGVRYVPDSILDVPATRMRASVERRTANREMLIDWILDTLIDGVDFGRIHVVSKHKCKEMAAGLPCENQAHYSKPCLFKSGAEKLCTMLGMRADFPDFAVYVGKASRNTPIDTVVMRCLLMNGDTCIGMGIGSRSTDSDGGDLNKSLKMAAKSAQCDAVLRTIGLSEIFTQDLEGGTVESGDDEPIGDGEMMKRILAVSTEYFGESSEAVLQSLALRRFNIVDGDIRKLPAKHVERALHALAQKHEAGK